MFFGKHIDVSYDVTLNGSVIDWFNEWVYLGVTLKSSMCFNCSITERINKFCSVQKYRLAIVLIKIFKQIKLQS